MGAIKRDSRSLDYSSYEAKYADSSGFRYMIISLNKGDPNIL